MQSALELALVVGSIVIGGIALMMLMISTATVALAMYSPDGDARDMFRIWIQILGVAMLGAILAVLMLIARYGAPLDLSA